MKIKASDPRKLTIKKTYFQDSPYALIHKMDDGSYWVEKRTTSIWYKCWSYEIAKTFRKEISDEYEAVGLTWKHVQLKLK